MPHNQLCLDLLHGIHRHADHDQQTGAAEVKAHAQTVRHPRRQSVKERPYQPKVIEVNAGDHHLRDNRDDDQIKRADQRDACQYIIDEV